MIMWEACWWASTQHWTRKKQSEKTLGLSAVSKKELYSAYQMWAKTWADTRGAEWKLFDTCLESIYCFQPHFLVYFGKYTKLGMCTILCQLVRGLRTSIDIKVCYCDIWLARKKIQNKRKQNEAQVGYKIVECDHSSSWYVMYVMVIHCQRSENINGFWNSPTFLG